MLLTDIRTITHDINFVSITVNASSVSAQIHLLLLQLTWPHLQVTVVAGQCYEHGVPFHYLLQIERYHVKVLEKRNKNVKI